MSLRMKNAKWEYRFSINGQRVTKLTELEATEPNRKKAARLETLHRAEILAGKRPAWRLPNRAFTEATGEFMLSVGVDHQGKDGTIKRVETSLASLRQFFGNRIIGAIRPADVERYKLWRLAEMGRKPITVRHDLDNLSKFFQWAKRMDLIVGNPAREVTKPSDADAVRIHVITAEEEFLYFESARRYPNLYDAARIMRNQGMRPDEVLCLLKANVDLDRGRVHIPSGKTKAARRTLKLAQESRLILEGRMSSAGPWVFPSPRDPVRHLMKLNALHDRVCTATGLSFVLYDLRHSFATRMAEAGVDLATLAAILGHNSLRSVTRYVHPTATHQEEAMVYFESVQTGVNLPVTPVTPVTLQAQARPRPTGIRAQFPLLSGNQSERPN